MQDIEMRTMSPEEMEILSRIEQINDERKKNIFKIIIGSIFCILSIGIVISCIWLIKTMPEFHSQINYNISKYKIINTVYKVSVRCMNCCPFIIPVGIAAVLIDALGQNKMNFLFSKLPLGHFSSCENNTNLVTKMTTVAAPSLLIGIFLTIQAIMGIFFADHMGTCMKIVLPIFTVLSGLSLITLLITTFIQGSLYGLLIRGSLIISANIGLGILFGILGSVAAALIIGIGIIIAALFFAIIILNLMSAMS